MVGARLLGLTTLAVVVALLVEYALHRYRLARIPLRIHVNGTRGKSSVTRLLAAALREAGHVTCAKTTGTLARMILPDGRELPVYRPQRPNIIEQVRIVATAAALKADALVVECMALQPGLQYLSEARLVRATHGVITNARPDHLDVMGPAPEDVARALCGMIPPGRVLFTAERALTSILADACRDRSATLSVTRTEAADRISDADMAGFSYVEHKENVALALDVLTALGIEREVALRGMRKATPDPGAMTEHRLDFFGRDLLFINGFAANDPVSTARIWEDALARYPERKKRIAIFNCRADRPERSEQLGRAFVEWSPAENLLLVGTGTYIFARAASAAGFDSSRIGFLEGQSVADVFEHVIGLVDRPTLVMGLGNIGGQGLELVRYFKNRSIASEAP